MKKIVIFTVMSVLLILGACSKDEGKPSNSGSADDGETTAGYGAIDHGVDDKQVGFNMLGGSIEEAAGIPAEEKEQVLAAFDVIYQNVE